MTNLQSLKNGELLDKIGIFTWSFGQLYHIETDDGCYEWSAPVYGRDNTIRKCEPYMSWVQRINIPYGRDKGKHMIRDYCGKDVKIV